MATAKTRQLRTVEGGGTDAWRVGQSAAETKSLVSLGAVLVALIASAGVYAVLVNGAASGARLAVAAPAADSTTTVAYFPSLFVNQAKEVDPQPPTF